MQTDLAGRKQSIERVMQRDDRNAEPPGFQKRVRKSLVFGRADERDGVAIVWVDLVRWDETLERQVRMSRHLLYERFPIRFVRRPTDHLERHVRKPLCEFTHSLGPLLIGI